MRKVIRYSLLVIGLLFTTYSFATWQAFYFFQQKSAKGDLPLAWADPPLAGLFTVPQAYSDELSDLEEEFQKIKQQLEETLEEKTQREQKLEEEKQKEQEFTGSLNSLQSQLTYSQTRLTETLVAIDDKQKEIETTDNLLQIRQEELNHQTELLHQQIRNLYINSFYDPATLFLQARDFSDFSKTVVFREAIIGSFKKKILELNQKIEKLNEQKQELEKQKEILKSQKLQLERQKQSFEQKIVSTQKAISLAQLQQTMLQQELVGLEHQLGELTQKQKEILAAKAAAALATTTVGNVEITRAAIEKEPPKDGKLYFSFWTYGYPHRVGMNQYGAYGRAKAGQNYEQILKAYYSGVEIVDYSVPETIKINRGGNIEEIPFEGDYLLGIGEMPSCWGKDEKGGMEALKAQAVAARTYALNYTNNGESPICIDQRCQVYVGESKVAGECGEYWKRAVEETEGQVIVYGGEPISAWYCSTAGGFTLSSQEVWKASRPYAQGIVDFADPSNLNSSFDGPQFGNSPWYHKSWGDEPWLSVEQVEDLFNASLLPEKYNDGLQEEAKGGMSTQEVIEALRLEGIESVSGLTSIEHFGSATKLTTKLRVYFPGGYKEVDASRFRFAFNLRSPGTDAIWTTRFDLLTSQ